MYRGLAQTMYEVFQPDILSRNISKCKNGEFIHFQKQDHV